MMLITKTAYSKLQPATKADLLHVLFGSSAEPTSLAASAHDLSAYDWTDRVDLSPGQVEQFFERELHDNTVNGLKAIAELGPQVTTAALLAAGVDNLSAFQRSTTRRVRSVTGDADAYLLAWDAWEDGEGQYAVTPATYRSLRIYFELD